MGRARRVLVVTWIVLSVAGALDHTIAETLVGRRFDLLLPHLKYGHVMFNKNPHTATVYSYEGADGVRHDLVDLVGTPAPGYARARLAISIAFKPDVPAELCLRTQSRQPRPLTFVTEEYDMDGDRSRPTRSERHVCGENGVLQR